MAYIPKVGDKVQYIAAAEIVAVSDDKNVVIVKSLTGETKDQFVVLPTEIVQPKK